MPRKETQTLKFLSMDATHQDIVDALGENKARLNNIISSQEETNAVLRMTHLGHELHLWDAEVGEGE